LIDYIVCPVCQEPLRISISHCVCDKGHQFPVIDGIPDLIAETKDGYILEEEEHWDNVAVKGKTTFMPDKYMNEKVYFDYRLEFEKCIKAVWPKALPTDVRIADIGCGPGSAITYLDKIGFQNVNYVGVDVSMKAMRTRVETDQAPPDNWNIFFLRGSANTRLFREGSLDIAFSASALHHLNLNTVIEWLAKCLKPNGALILHEPNSSNAFAKIGRKLIRDYHTKGEKPIHPEDVTQLAHKYNLALIYENGLHYLTGSLQYLMGILEFPIQISSRVYQMSRYLDTLVTSPSRNYSFVQAYKKIS
jgi:SAM-dependent methyltransferase